MSEDELELEDRPPEEPTLDCTELEKKQRREYRDNIASGKGSFRIPARLARILGAGVEDGFNDYTASLPSNPVKSADFIYVRGYTSGYRMASKGKIPQCVQLRRLGLFDKIDTCRGPSGH